MLILFWLEELSEDVWAVAKLLLVAELLPTFVSPLIMEANELYGLYAAATCNSLSLDANPPKPPTAAAAD